MQNRADTLYYDITQNGIKPEAINPYDLFLRNANHVSLLALLKQNKQQTILNQIYSHIAKPFTIAGVNPRATDGNKRTLLHWAVLLNQASHVEALLTINFDPNACGRFRLKPLHYAAQGGNVDIINTLIAHGATIDPRTKANATPLFFAAQKGHEQAFLALLSNGANPYVRLLKPSAYHYPARKKDAPIHLLGMSDDNVVMMQAVLEAPDANVNFRGANNFTALHYAVRAGQSEMAKLLISQKANVDVTTNGGGTPLLMSVLTRNPSMVQILLDAKADANLALGKSSKDYLPIQTGDAPLHAAVLTGQKDVVIALLDAGADINAKGFKESTALHYACSIGHYDIVNLLIKRGAELDATDKNLNTPLHFAAKNNQAEIVKLLIQNEASVRVDNINDETPKDIAHKDIKNILRLGALNEKMTYPSHSSSSFFKKSHTQLKDADTQAVHKMVDKFIFNNETNLEDMNSDELSADVRKVALGFRSA